METLHIEISDLKKRFAETIVKAVTIAIKSHRSKPPENSREFEIDTDPLFIEESFREEILIRIPETNDKTFGCSMCSKVYKTSLGLIIHQKDHEDAISKQFRCYECDQLFGNYNLLTAHYLQLHSIENESQNPVDEEFERCLVEMNFLDTRMCHICFIPCPTLAVFSSHVISAHADQTDLMKWVTFPCSQCNDRFPSVDSLKNHWTLNCCVQWKMNRNSGNNNVDVICENCGLQCANENILSNHVDVHHDEKKINSNRVQCEHCGKSFANKSNLLLHIQNVHETKIKVTCELCGKKMAEVTLRSHLKKIHSEKKQFKCNICSQLFATSCNLKWHLNIHTGDRPYKCSFCDKSYRSSAARGSHELIHKGGCECKVCGLKFKYYPQLSQHKKTNHGDNSKNPKEFNKCKTCGKTCPSHFALTQHRRYHHMGNECECDECGQKCKNQAALKSHKRVHEDFLRFGCSLCDKKFRFHGNFYSHRKTHTHQTAMIIKLTEPPTKVSLVSNSNNSEKEAVRDISSNSTLHSENDRERSLSNSSSSRLQVEMENYNREPPDFPEDDYEPDNESDYFESGDSGDPPVLYPQSEIFDIDKTTSNQLAEIPTVSAFSCSSTVEVTKQFVSTPSPTDFRPTVLSSSINLPNSTAPLSSNQLQAQEIFVQENQWIIASVESKDQSHDKDGDLQVRQCIAKENDHSNADEGKLSKLEDCAATAKAVNKAECSEFEYYESDDNNVFESGESCVEKEFNQCEPRNVRTNNISRKMSKSFPHDPFSSQLFVKLTKLKEYKCEPCNKSFFHENELKIHEGKRDHIRKRMLEKLDAGKEDTRRPSKKFNCEPKENQEKSYTCKVCDAELTSAWKLDLHCRKDHPGIKSFQCEKCDEAFSTQEYLQNHNRRIHLGIKDKRTPSKPSICKSKIKIKNLICEECGKAFDRLHELKIHQKLHAGIKDFVCDECGKGFNRAFVLKEHKKRHAGIRDFVCEECGAAFFRKNELNDHIQSVHHKHDRKKEYKLKNKDKIKSWKKSKPTIYHPTKRAFSCELCSVKFSKESLLIKHTELHDPSRPYACDLCGYRFKFQSNVHSHKIYLHKETEKKK